MNRIKVPKQFKNISVKNLRIMIKFILVHPLHSFFTLYHKVLYETIYKNYISELLNGKNYTIISPDEFLKKSEHMKKSIMYQVGFR